MWGHDDLGRLDVGRFPSKKLLDKVGWGGIIGRGEWRCLFAKMRLEKVILSVRYCSILLSHAKLLTSDIADRDFLRGGAAALDEMLWNALSDVVMTDSVNLR